jgi:hypothetical protein
MANAANDSFAEFFMAPPNDIRDPAMNNIVSEAAAAGTPGLREDLSVLVTH